MWKLAVLAAERPAAEHGEVVEGGGAGFLDCHRRGDIDSGHECQVSRVSLRILMLTREIIL